MLFACAVFVVTMIVIYERSPPQVCLPVFRASRRRLLPCRENKNRRGDGGDANRAFKSSFNKGA